jgi:hypothetical protein
LNYDSFHETKKKKRLVKRFKQGKCLSLLLLGSIPQSANGEMSKTRTIPVDVLPRPIPGTISAEEKAANDVRVGCTLIAGRTDPSLLTVCEAIRENMAIIATDDR